MQSYIVILTIAELENNQLPSMEHFWKLLYLWIYKKAAYVVFILNYKSIL